MKREYDLSKLEELADGDREFVIDIVSTFLDHAPIQVKEIEEAFEQADYKMLGDVAHKLKPSLDLMGIDSLYKVIRLIEQCAKEETKQKELPRIINEFTSIFEKVLDEIKSDYSSH
ncbi:MAG: Hpt domain-containing protein [Bacteroidota bacterium]